MQLGPRKQRRKSDMAPLGQARLGPSGPNVGPTSPLPGQLGARAACSPVNPTVRPSARYPAAFGELGPLSAELPPSHAARLDTMLFKQISVIFRKFLKELRFLATRSLDQQEQETGEPNMLRVTVVSAIRTGNRVVWGPSCYLCMRHATQ